MLYRQIILEWGQDTESGVWGLGYSPDNGKNFYVLNTTHGRKYRAEDGNRLYPYISDQIQDKIDTVVAPAKSAADSAVSAADSAVSAADAAVASAQVTSDAVTAIASATAEAKQGANEAMSRAKSAWDVATGAKEAVTDFAPLLKSAQSDASKSLTQIADTASALSDAKTAFGSDVAAAKELANTAQTTADSAVKSASSVADDLAAVASQAKANTNGITKVTSDVGLLQTTVADNSGNISTIQETAKQIQQAVSDNAGNITVAKQTADSAVTVASDARSSATVAIQTASQASITASNASGQAASAVLTASGAMTTASNAKSDATVAIQTASGASLTATNAKDDATVAKQTASEATVQASNAESDFAQLSVRANKIETNVANNSGAIASVQQTANGLTTTVGKVDDRVKKIEDTTNWTTKTGALDMDTLTTTQNIYYRDTNLKNADGETGWAYIQVVSTGERVTQTVWHDRSSIQHTRTGAIDGSTYDWDAWNKVATNAQVVQVKQTVDGIATTINDPKTGLNATYQTAAGNATTISNVKGDVTQLQATATGLTSRVGDLESKTSTQETDIDQNKAAITLKADQTTVDTLKGTVNENTATLKTQASQIQAKVSASDVTGMLTGYATQTYTQSLVTQKADDWNLNLTNLKTDVNAIKTTGGGVNLAIGTSSKDQSAGDASQTTGWQSITIATFDNPQAGRQYTISVNTKYNGGSWKIQIWDGTSPTQRAKWITSGNSFTSTQEQKNTFTFTWPSGSNKYLIAQLVNNNNGGQIFWNSAMLEEGTVAHTWSPAPSDMATVTSVTNLSATVDGIQAQVYNSDGSSRITQLSNLIQSKVGTDDFNNLKQAVGLQTLDSADINNMKTNGHYFVHNLANNPIGGWVYVDVTGDGSSRIRQDVYQDNGTKHKYRRWFNAYWTGWEEGATYTEINQLQDAINLRVTKGDLISQINLQAGTSLIQSNKLVLDAGTTIITGEAWIPGAAIDNLTADQIQAGTLSGSKVHAGDNSGNAIDMGALSTNYVGFHAYANNGDNTFIDYNGIHNYGANYDTRIQQGKITTNYLAVKGGGMIDFQSGGAGITIDNQEIKFYNSGDVNGGISFAGSNPIADRNSGGGNELRLRYDGSFALTPISDESTKLVASTKSMGLGYDQAGSTTSDKNLTGLQVNNSDRYVRLGVWNSNSMWSQAEFNSDGVNINYSGLSIGLNNNLIHMYMNGNYSANAIQLKVDGWAWVNGWVEAAGHSQHSALSLKTRIEEADPDHMLDLVNNTELTTFAFKSEVAEGTEFRHIGPIIDDVNDVAQYRTPAEFIAPTKTARDDDNMIGALFGAVQALTKRIKTLEDKLNE